MSTFKKFLIQRGYRTSTADSYSIGIKLFFNWCESRRLDPKKATIEDLYNYQTWMRTKGRAINTIRERIQVVKLFYSFIKRSPNPALHIRTERRDRTLPSNLLDAETLLEIYLSLLPRTNKEKRDKCLLGLIIFQGAKRDELEQVELDHLDIPNQRIYLPSTSRTNSRYLSLHRRQVDELEEYADDVRQVLSKKYNAKTSKLFFSLSRTTAFGLQNPLALMFCELRQDFPFLNNVTQLRSSRISLWVNSLDLREAQYLSGFKYVSSLLRYQHVDLERLKS